MQNTSSNFGVLYFAANRPQYVYEAALSAISFSHHNPDVPITLLTPYRVAGPMADLFNHIEYMNEACSEKGDHPYTSKVRAISKTPYERTLYLDCDTFVTCNITEKFSRNVNGLSLTPVLSKNSNGDLTESKRDKKTLYNTGVIFFTKNETRNIKAWLNQTKESEDTFKMPGKERAAGKKASSIGDQNIFNNLQISQGWDINNLEALKYNFRYSHLNTLSKDKATLDKVKIFHMHECIKNLEGLNINGFDEIVAKFRRVRQKSNIAAPPLPCPLASNDAKLER